MTKTQRGNAIAALVWKRLKEMEAIALVPWVDDPIKKAEERGYHRAVTELLTFIQESSRHLESNHKPRR